MCTSSQLSNTSDPFAVVLDTGITRWTCVPTNLPDMGSNSGNGRASANVSDKTYPNIPNAYVGVLHVIFGTEVLRKHVLVKPFAN